MTEYLDTLRTRLDSTVKAFNDVVGSYETRVLVTARKFKELGATSGSEIEPLQAIDTVPRILHSANLLGLPDEVVVDASGSNRRSSRATEEGLSHAPDRLVVVSVSAVGVAARATASPARSRQKPEATSLSGKPLYPIDAAESAEARSRPGAGGEGSRREAERRRRHHLGRTPARVSVALPGRDCDVLEGHRAASEQPEDVPPPRPSLHHASVSSIARSPTSTRRSR